MVRISKPGIYPLNDEAYHGDPCPEPSLSASIAKVIDGQTPRHAWGAHPRLNPKFEAKNRREFDLGSVSHCLLQGLTDQVRVLKHDSYRKDAAKQDRDACYADGVFPVLEKDYAECVTMAHAARAQLDNTTSAAAFKNGRPEMTMVWTEEVRGRTIWCRSKLDWLHSTMLNNPPTGNVLFDYKSTGTFAGPDDWGRRTCYDMDADLQESFYRRGIRKLLGLEVNMNFVVQENFAPYCLAVYQFSTPARYAADVRIDRAMQYWAWCMEHNAWPGYSRDVNTIAWETWREIKFTTQKDENEGVDVAELLKTGIAFQAPLETE